MEDEGGVQQFQFDLMEMNSLLVHYRTAACRGRWMWTGAWTAEEGEGRRKVEV